MDARQRNEARKSRGRHSRETRGSFGGSERSSVIELPERFKDKNWFKVSDKQKNEIDIVEFEITAEWYPQLKARGGGQMIDHGMIVGALDYKLEIPVHYNVGPLKAAHFCPFDGFGKPCPLCEEKMAKLEANKYKWDRPTMGHLNASWRDFYNVYDYNDPEAGFKPWEAAFTSFEKPMNDELDKQKDELFPWALDAGNTIEFKGREKPIGEGRTYIEPQIPDFFSREPYSESILDEVIQFDQFVIFSTYDEIAADHFGMASVETTATGYGDQKPPAEETQQTHTRTRNTSRTREENPPPDTDRRQRSDPGANPDDANPCPSGHNFGHDCNKQPHCQTCPDESFDKCVALQDKFVEEEKKGTDRPTRQRSAPPAEETPPADGQRRRRRS